MSLVKMYNKKIGVTYVYESESYWDKEKKQPRNRRKLIGKIDPDTGMLIPTGKAGRNTTIAVPDLHPQTTSKESESSVGQKNMLSIITDKNTEIIELKDRIKELESKCEHYEVLIARIKAMIKNE